MNIKKILFNFGFPTVLGLLIFGGVIWHRHLSDGTGGKVTGGAKSDEPRITATSSTNIVRVQPVTSGKLLSSPAQGGIKAETGGGTASSSGIKTDWRIRADSLGGAGAKAFYNVHNDVMATYFEGGTPAGPGDAGISNQSSAWITDWTGALGGADKYQDITDRNASNPYQPKSFTLKRNAFYAALPADPELAGASAYYNFWQDGTHNPLGQFVGRWIEVTRSQAGVSYRCYAQWEDVGPGAIESDFMQFSYVFGSASVSNSYNGAGLDVSPACAIALGITPELGESKVSWRFVDTPPTGPWSLKVN